MQQSGRMQTSTESSTFLGTNDKHAEKRKELDSEQPRKYIRANLTQEVKTATAKAWKH